MKEYSIEEIQQQYEKLPVQLQKAIASPDIHQKIQEIGKRNDLMIDQIGDLVDQIGLIMLGLEKSSNFVQVISSKISIDASKAQEIAKQINDEVFSLLKKHMREQEEGITPRQNLGLSDLENAGGFQIEKSESNIIEENKETKEQILSSIENPMPSPKTVAKGDGVIRNIEPLVDQLLQSPTVVHEEQIVKKVEPPLPSNLPTEASQNEKSASDVGQNPRVANNTQQNVQQSAKPRGADMYREPIE